jgi:hypothetical protein
MFHTSRRTGPLMSLFISMLRDSGGKDWESQTPLDGTVIGHNAGLHIHHFFPRALLTKHGKDVDEINTFANYAVLSAGTNLNVATEEPATYLDRIDVKSSDLDAQCIPSDRELWRIRNYDMFVQARRRLLARRANNFLGIAERRADERSLNDTDEILEARPSTVGGVRAPKPRRDLDVGRKRQREYRQPILDALNEMRGKARMGEVLDRVHEKVRNMLTPFDYEQHSGGDPRWRKAAQFERLMMVQEGLLKSGSSRGLWELSSRGRAQVQTPIS